MMDNGGRRTSLGNLTLNVSESESELRLYVSCSVISFSYYVRSHLDNIENIFNKPSIYQLATLKLEVQVVP